MTFPLEPRFVAEFAEGLRDHPGHRREAQLPRAAVARSALQRAAAAGRSSASRTSDGERAASGRRRSSIRKTSPASLARLPAGPPAPSRTAADACIAEIDARDREERRHARCPTFCSGCPHNRSTLLLEGQVAGGGIGCHGMAATLAHIRPRLRVPHAHGRRRRALDRHGAVRRAPAHFPEHRRRHLLSLRLAGHRSLRRRRRQHHLQDSLQRRGGDDRRPAGRAARCRFPTSRASSKPKACSKTVVLTDDLEKYDRRGAGRERRRCAIATSCPRCCASWSKIPGVTVIIYDQQCAAEKRRLRSRGKLEEPTAAPGDQRRASAKAAAIACASRTA